MLLSFDLWPLNPDCWDSDDSPPPLPARTPESFILATGAFVLVVNPRCVPGAEEIYSWMNLCCFSSNWLIQPDGSMNVRCVWCWDQTMSCGCVQRCVASNRQKSRNLVLFSSYSISSASVNLLFTTCLCMNTPGFSLSHPHFKHTDGPTGCRYQTWSGLSLSLSLDSVSLTPAASCCSLLINAPI